MKSARWFLLLAGCMIFGCASGPVPQQAAWPWEHSKDYGNNQTGDYFTFRGNVANFGEAPKVMKSVSPEAVQPHIPDSNSASETSVTKTQPSLLSTESEAGSGTIESNAEREYDFIVRDVKVAPQSYLPMETVRATYDITALNHGNSPVSVTIGIDPSSQNISTDKTLPFYAVVPPNSDKALMRIRPKFKNESYNFSYTYSWNIGDYTASHNCPEHYRFPFGKNVQAFASVSDDTNTSLLTRNAVIFSMPVGTPVLAARKGIIIQIKNDKIDILHDDSTIATYGHLGKIAEGIFAGKAVSTEDIIGVVGTTADKKEGYMQLTVWRPEPPPIASLKTVSSSVGLDHVSFPIKFCSTDSSGLNTVQEHKNVRG